MTGATDVRADDAEIFADAVHDLLTTLDVLPPDWQQRAVDIIKAAYPDNRDVRQLPPSGQFSRDLSGLTEAQQRVLDMITPIGTKL